MAARTAVVVGAGMSGLAAAGALARTGWRVTLLERADRLRPGRAAVLLWPNAVRALASLGLGGAGGVDAIATPVPPLGVRRPDGRWLHEPDGSAPPVVAVHRADLHDMLVAGLSDQVEICTGVTVRTTRPTSKAPGGQRRHHHLGGRPRSSAPTVPTACCAAGSPRHRRWSAAATRCGGR